MGDTKEQHVVMKEYQFAVTVCGINLGKRGE